MESSAVFHPPALEPISRLDQLAEADWRLADLRRRAREFRERFIEPVAADLDREMLLDPERRADDLLRHGCEYGFLSLVVPAFVRGAGGLALQSAVLLEELSAGCAGISNLFGAHYLGISGLLMGVDVSLFDTLLREVADEEKRGVPVVFAAALTEPMAGSDVEDQELLPLAKIVSSARKVPGGYVLNGRKVFISNGSIARYTLVVCPLDQRHPLETWSAFVVPSGTPGFTVARVERKMGQRACHAAELVFEDCFVPERLRVGVEGRGMDVTDLVLAASRGPVAAIATGIGRGAYEKALAYARREGLLDRQWAQLALADMLSRVELGRCRYLEAAQRFDGTVARALLGPPGLLDAAMRLVGPVRRSPLGQRLVATGSFKRLTSRLHERIDSRVRARSWGLSSMAKFTCSDLAVEVCLRALEMLGPAGAEERAGVEKHLRDAKLTQIYEGTNQLNRLATFKALVREVA